MGVGENAGIGGSRSLNNKKSSEPHRETRWKKKHDTQLPRKTEKGGKFFEARHGRRTIPGKKGEKETAFARKALLHSRLARISNFRRAGLFRKGGFSR